jgi:hypothetical protein
MHYHYRTSGSKTSGVREEWLYHMETGELGAENTVIMHENTVVVIQENTVIT